ncbi:hypothetical protein Salat_0164700 [Sesamum alatum]|uniref:Reverse transcriptase zinc-binding domain-containing protein n=1 Tax=Sesamum alatum TaxID=300844 RepID=A0AAE2CY20_9LAMI|nr:hypothetical protein Salat_0164700 [Sesamum alatum]
MKIGFWNVRGFNRPLKHNGVAHLIKNNNLCLLGILETKLAASTIPRILHRSFPGWCQANNFDMITGGRILIIWNPAVIDLQSEDISQQVIHCRVTNKSSQLSFYITFTYGLYTVVNRRSMWEKLLELGQHMDMPWLILGDFNCVKSPTEKQLGVPPTWYELKDFTDCCLSLGLHDAPTTGCFYTWYSNNSNPVWCKLDRVFFNNEWLEAGLHCNAHFNPPGCLSDHSPGIVSILDPPVSKSKPFRFFNMWANHPDFTTTVEHGWNLNVDGTPQFSLCRKLKALKGPLKAFNNLHFSHISVRAKEVDLALQDAQLELESNPGNSVIRDSLGELRKKTIFLAEAERHFYYQKAKIHFLKMGDRNTKFFHDMVKRNAAKSSIMAISKSDGSTITSAEDIGREFTDYFTSLLGTEVQTLPVDNDVIFMAGIQDNELHGILARMEFARGEMPVRYLGIPLAAQRLSVSDYSLLVDKIASNISKWAAKSLSFAGRLELIRSVIQGVECFWLQIFPLPATVIEKIHHLCRNFLWNSRRAPVAWEEWVNNVYLRGGSIWEWQPKKGDSPLLRRLADIRDRLITAFGKTGAAVESMAASSNLKGLETSKAYEYFRPKHTRQPWKAAIWRAFIPPKYSFILWLGIRGRLATRDRLAFLACVWSDIRQWLGINRRMSTILSAIKWLKKEKTGSSVQNKARLLALACTVYSLWRHRNEVIFEGKAPCPEGLVISIRITVYRLLLTLFPHGMFAL